MKRQGKITVDSDTINCVLEVGKPVGVKVEQYSGTATGSHGSYYFKSNQVIVVVEETLKNGKTVKLNMPCYKGDIDSMNKYAAELKRIFAI